MSPDPFQPDRPGLVVAEEVLRTIYGDDLKGCPVSLEKIADIIDEGLKQASEEDRDLRTVYEKLVEAVHLLSTPPEPGNVTDAEKLQSLLGERLDAIHSITSKTLDATARLKLKSEGEPPGGS